HRTSGRLRSQLGAAIVLDISGRQVTKQSRSSKYSSPYNGQPKGWVLGHRKDLKAEHGPDQDEHPVQPCPTPESMPHLLSLAGKERGALPPRRLSRTPRRKCAAMRSLTGNNPHASRE